MKKNIEFLCSSCGNNQFKTTRPKLSGLRPTLSNMNSSETIMCSKCGAKESYKKLERNVISTVKKQVEIDLKRMFKKAGFK